MKTLLLKQKLVAIFAVALSLVSLFGTFYGFIQHNYSMALCGIGILLVTFSTFLDFKELIEGTATPVKVILWVFMLCITLGAALIFVTAVVAQKAVLVEYPATPFILTLLSGWLMTSVAESVAREAGLVLVKFFAGVALISASIVLITWNMEFIGIPLLTIIIFLVIVRLGWFAKANNIKLI